MSGYGNNIKDATNAGGPRVPTAGNPLGISGMGSQKPMLPGGKLPKGTQVNAKTAPKKVGSAKNPLGL